MAQSSIFKCCIEHVTKVANTECEHDDDEEENDLYDKRDGEVEVVF